MKTLQQLHRLPAPARRRLAFVMNQHSRPSLKNLYDFLVAQKAEASPDKETLYHVAFSEPYTADKDYLLRNEIRLLGAEIDEVLATEEFLKQYNANPSFKALWRYRADTDPAVLSKLNPLPETPAPKDFAYDQPVHLADTLEIALKRALGSHEMHQEAAEEMVLTAEKLIELRRIEAARKLAQASLIHGTALRWAKKGPDETHLTQSKAHFDLTAALEVDPVSAFLFAQLRSQCLQGHAKIKALEAGLSDLARCEDTKLFERTAKEMGFLAMIALEWYLLGAYEIANGYYEAALNKATSKRHPMLMAIVSNYMSNLLKGENFARAIAIVEQYQSHFVHNPQAHFFMESLKAMSYIFLDQPSPALATVPRDIQQRRGGTYLVFRLVQAIAFFLQGDAEAAEREATNIAKMIRYWKKHDRDQYKELDLDYLTVVGWLGQYFQACQQLAPEQDARLQRLKTEIADHPGNANPLFQDFLPLRWLRRRL